MVLPLRATMLYHCYHADIKPNYTKIIFIESLYSYEESLSQPRNFNLSSKLQSTWNITEYWVIKQKNAKKLLLKASICPGGCGYIYPFILLNNCHHYGVYVMRTSCVFHANGAPLKWAVRLRIQTRIREREKSQKECFCTVLFSPPVAVRIDVWASYTLSGFILKCVAAGVTSLPILASMMLPQIPSLHIRAPLWAPFCKFRRISHDIFYSVIIPWETSLAGAQWK